MPLTPPFHAAEELERCGEAGTPGFRELVQKVGEAIEVEYPPIRCVGCKKTFRDPTWRCRPCAVQKERVLGEYRTTIDPVRYILALDARAKVKFDAEKFISVKLRGHGLIALRTLREVIADVDPGAATEVQQVLGRRGGQKQRWSFKVTQSEGLHTLFSPAFRGVGEGGFVALSAAGAFAFHPPAVLSVHQTKDYGSIPVLTLTVSTCCLTKAGNFRFTRPYMREDLKPWRAQVMRSIRDAIGLVLQGTPDATMRASLTTPAMRSTLRALG